MTDLTDLTALSLLPSSCWRRASERLRGGEPPGVVLETVVAALPRCNTHPAALRVRATAACQRASTSGITPIAWTDPAYPSALAAIADPPFVLWTRGGAEALQRPAVAMVGSRAASSHGVAVAEQLASDLAGRGVAVVSGLARGIDAAAHRGALAGRGVTIGVLGSGVDVIYPPEHKTLARDVEAAGLVMSELIPGTPPLRQFFPLRNRIISGLARAVVVIEAGEKSGSLITARCALEQGRDVLAVPGNVLSGRNRGAHALLRDGARIVEGVDDILDELGLLPARRTSRFGTPAPNDPLLAHMIAGEPVDLDALIERSGLASARLLTRLFELELQGSVARVGGGRFVRI